MDSDVPLGTVPVGGTALGRALVGSRAWLLPVMGAMVYPTLLRVFLLSAQVSQASGAVALKGVLAACSIALMGLAVGVPALALRALIGMRSDGSALVRRVLHAAVATPPLYILSSQLAWLLKVDQWLDVLWLAGWGLIALTLGRTSDSRSEPRASASNYIAPLRVVHGVAALLLLVGFLAMHVANHLVALWTVPANQAVMKVLRIWYRSEWVEPMILALCATMVITGLPLVAHYTRTGRDRFRTLQTAAGAYFVAFLPPHIYAVLGSRSAHVETDWIFAQGGPGGLLASRACDLIPYYLLSIFFLVMHASLGLRVVLLNHGVRDTVAARAFNVLTASGGVAALLIVAALLGLQAGA
jgi:hypothetical protein